MLSTTFNTGLIFYYWKHFAPDQQHKLDATYDFNTNDHSGYTSSQLYIKHDKYPDLKSEIIESGYVLFSEYKNIIMLKAENYLNVNVIRKLKADVFDMFCNHNYGIKDADPVKIEHVTAIICYCDLSEFSTEWSATFRFKYYGENLQSIKNRNSHYYHLSKALREMVQCFGKSGSQHNSNGKENGPFYTGINRTMTLPAFSIRFCGPTSTTRHKEIAIRFADRDGMIIELYNHITELHFFDCSFISAFREEDERLMMGGAHRIQIQSITIISTCSNYENYVHLLSLFDRMITGTHYLDLRHQNDVLGLIMAGKNYRHSSIIPNNILFLKNMIQVSINESAVINEYDPYVHDLWKSFSFHKNQLTINLYYLDEAAKRGFSFELLDLILHRNVNVYG
eukprot:459685_1